MLGQNEKLTVELDDEDISTEKLTIYSPASSNTIRDAGVPLAMPEEVWAVYVKAYGVFADAAVWLEATTP